MNQISLFVSVHGIPEDLVVSIGADASVKDLIDALVAQGVSVPREAEVFLEEAQEPVEGGGKAHFKNKGRVHLSTCKKIQVSVTYGPKTVSKTFPPSAPVAAVHAWASHELLQNDIDRKEHVLQICGSDDQPSPRTQIGALAPLGECAVCFNLVPAVRVEG